MSKMTRSSKGFQFLCAAMVGFGQLCIFTSYDSESFLLESVIHSIHEREPQKISQYAGYYGQAVLYGAYMVCCFFSPSILHYANAKVTLVLASICFASFPIGFFFTNAYYFYFSSVLLGIGFALFYQGQGGYLMSHSTRNTISENYSISWSIGTCSLLLSTVVMAVITKMTADQNSVHPSNPAEEIPKLERQFSDMEITLLFGSVAGITFLGTICFLLMPSKDVENCIESGEKREPFVKTLKLTCRTVISPEMMQLVPFFLLCGGYTSFWLSIFPTAMNFNMHNSNLIYLPAIYSFGAGIGEVSMGVSISAISRRYKDFGLRPSMIIGAVLTVLYCVLVLSSTPYDAPMRPTDKLPLLFQQSNVFVFFLGLLAGLGDCCIKSTRGVLCAIVMPDRRAQAVSVSRLYQAFVSCIIYFLSPNLNIFYYTIGIPILVILATVLFFQVARKTQKMESDTNEQCED